MADHLIPGKLYRLTKNYFWFSNDIDWNDATADEIAEKNAKAGDILIFIDFKSYVSWGGKEYTALSFISAEQGGLVHTALSSDNWEIFFERIQEEDE